MTIFVCFFTFIYYFKGELNKWFLSPNISLWTSKCVYIVWLPVTSNDSHKSDASVRKWVAKVPKAKLLKVTVALNCRLVIADCTVKLNNAYFPLRGK